MTTAAGLATAGLAQTMMGATGLWIVIALYVFMMSSIVAARWESPK
jgi:hypothetical protein